MPASLKIIVQHKPMQLLFYSVFRNSCWILDNHHEGKSLSLCLSRRGTVLLLGNVCVCVPLLFLLFFFFFIHETGTRSVFALDTARILLLLLLVFLGFLFLKVLHVFGNEGTTAIFPFETVALLLYQRQRRNGEKTTNEMRVLSEETPVDAIDDGVHECSVRNNNLRHNSSIHHSTHQRPHNHGASWRAG